MTAAAYTISNGTVTVDMNLADVCSHLRVGYRFNNPVFALSTPLGTSQNIGDNTIPVNLKMVNNSFDLSFHIFDGPGSWDFKTPGTTTFEKIGYLANYVANAKILTLGTATYYGHIEAVNIPFVSRPERSRYQR